MDTRLAKLISDYQACVAEAVAVLEKAGFPRPASDSAWAGTDGPPTGTVVSGYRFYKHGFGCAVHGPGWTVDFDFGDQGQIDGVDLHRLRTFAERNLSKYGFESAEEIAQLVGRHAVQADDPEGGAVNQYSTSSATTRVITIAHQTGRKNHATIWNCPSHS